MLTIRMANSEETNGFKRIDGLAVGDTVYLNRFGRGKYCIPANRETSIVVARVLSEPDSNGNDFTALVKNDDTFVEKHYNSFYFGRTVAAPVTEVIW